MFLETLRKKKGVLRKVRHSIRTRYSLATAFFLLMILGLFYVGGRIVLVHLVKDAETQVRKIGADINRLADRNAGMIRQYVESRSDEEVNRPINQLLGLYGKVNVELALRLGTDGRFVEGYVAGGHAGVKLTPSDVVSYESQFLQWAATASGAGGLPAGIVCVRGVSYYAAPRRCEDGRFLVLGSRFDTSAFTAQLNESFAGLELHVTGRRPEATGVPVTHVQSKRKGKKEGQSFGLSSMVSEAFEFDSGGFWKRGENPFEAVYTIRDIA